MTSLVLLLVHFKNSRALKEKKNNTTLSTQYLCRVLNSSSKPFSHEQLYYSGMGSFLLLLGWPDLEVRQAGNMFLQYFICRKEREWRAKNFPGFTSCDRLPKKTCLLALQSCCRAGRRWKATVVFLLAEQRRNVLFFGTFLAATASPGSWVSFRILTKKWFMVWRASLSYRCTQEVVWAWKKCKGCSRR